MIVVLLVVSQDGKERYCLMGVNSEPCFFFNFADESSEGSLPVLHSSADEFSHRVSMCNVESKRDFACGLIDNQANRGAPFGVWFFTVALVHDLLLEVVAAKY